MKLNDPNRMDISIQDPWSPEETMAARKWETETIASIVYAMHLNEWESIHLIIEKTAKKQLKERISPALETRWVNTWEKISHDMLLTGVHWEKWKVATVHWFRKLYEKERIVECVNIKNDAPEAISTWWENTQSMGHYFEWKALPKKEKDLKIWDNPWFIKTQTWMAEPKLSDQEVWAKALHEERGEDYLPWQSFIVASLHHNGHSQAFQFWKKEMLRLPLIKHRLGGFRASWCLLGLEGSSALDILEYKRQWMNRPNQNKPPFEQFMHALTNIDSIKINLSGSGSKKDLSDYLALLFDRPDVWLKDGPERRERDFYAGLHHTRYWASVELWARSHPKEWLLLCSTSERAVKHHTTPLFVDFLIELNTSKPRNLEDEKTLWFEGCIKHLLSDFNSQESLDFRIKMTEHQAKEAFKSTISNEGMLELMIQSLDVTSISPWCQWLESQEIVSHEKMDHVSSLALKRSFEMTNFHKRRATL